MVKFIEWCVESGTSRETCEDYAKYLRKPLNPENKWSVLAYKKYYRWVGDEEAWSRLKTKQSRPDLKVPTASEVLETLEAACESSEELCIIYKLLIESGARLNEVVKMLNEFDPSKLKEHDGFYTYALGYFRGSKQAYYVFSVTKPRPFKCSDNWVSNWASKRKMVNPKYVRKFVATAMVAAGIPIEIVSFIHGKTPRSILERNYLSLYTLALKYYPKYIEHLKKMGMSKDGG